MAAGTADPEQLPSRLVCARSDGWASAGYDAGAGRYRLCAGFGRSRNLWAVCHDRALVCIRALWSQPHPGSRAGFGSRPRDSRGRAPSLGWRSYTVALASMMAVVSGLVCVLIGVLRLGFVTELLSKRFATDT